MGDEYRNQASSDRDAIPASTTREIATFDFFSHTNPSGSIATSLQPQENDEIAWSANLLRRRNTNARGRSAVEHDNT